MSNKPLVSVVIPCYNAALYVEEAVRSIMGQSYSNLEIIVINDGSTDSTKKILIQLSEEDSRIRYVENEQNIQLVATLNKGIRLSNGVFIARMDADDISHKNRIEKQVDFFTKNTEVSILGTATLSFKNKGSYNYTPQPCNNLEIKSKLFVASAFHHPTVMFNTKVLDKSKIVYDKDYYRLEDYALWVSLMFDDDIIFANLKEALLDYRLLESSESTISSRNVKEKNKTVNKIISKLFQNYKFKLSDKEQYHYVLSTNRVAFSNIDIRYVFKAYNKVLRQNKKFSLNSFLYERWIVILYYASKKMLAKNMFLIVLSKYTWCGLFNYIKKTKC